jgi:signal transduction histidine kinase
MSLRRRFVLVFAAFAAIITALGGYLSWRASSAALERELDDKLRQVAGAAAQVGFPSSMVVGLQPGDESSSAWNVAYQRLSSLRRYVDAAYLFRQDRTVLVSTEGAEALPIGTRLRFLDLYPLELDQAERLGSSTTPVFEGGDGRLFKYGFVRLEQSDIYLAVLMRADYLSPLDTFTRTALFGSLAATILAALLAAALAAEIVRPLERLSRAALRIQRGHLTRPVAVERADELGRLSQAMERMRKGILQRDEQLRLMLAQVAHEIRNPLGGLELFAAAAQDMDDPEERDRILGRIRNEVEGLNSTINDFLVFARPLEPHLELHDIRGPIREAADLVSAELNQREGALTLVMPDEPVLARVDPGHAKGIMLNLLRNAAQAGDRVELEVTTHHGEVIVTVRDDGPGIPMDLRDRIFDPFVTDKEQGAGLGLPIVQRLAEANHGRIELAAPGAPLGSGAEFRLYLPGAEELPLPDHLE